jgi:hypothetical protein
MNLQNIATVVGLIVGIGGFIVGVAGSIFGYYQWREHQKEKIPKLVLTLNLGRDHKGAPVAVGWFIANDYWDKPITIDQVGITTGKGKFIPIGVGPNIPQEDALNTPFTLQPGANKSFNINISVLHIVLIQQEKAKGRLRIKAAVRDSTRRMHVGRNHIPLEILKDKAMKYDAPD